MANKIDFDIRINGNGGASALRRVSEEAHGAGRAIDEISRSAANATSGLRKMADESIGLSSCVTALNSLKGLVSDMVAPYNSFETAMARANTMAGTSGKEFDDLTGKIKSMSREIPMLREELANGLYETVSNGVPKDNWISYLDASARTAKGGCADLGQTVSVTATLIKNYGESWDKAGEIQDKMQVTAKNGKTSIAELGNALPRVSGSAAQLGVEMNELMAVFATTTGVTGNTSEVSTQLAAVLNSLIKPSSEATKAADAMGIRFDAAAVRASGGFKNFLAQLDASVKAYAQSSGQLSETIYGQLFGSAEALRLLGSLTGEQKDTFVSNINAMADSTGAIDEAFNQMSDTGESTMQIFKNNIQSVTDALSDVFGWSAPFIDMAANTGIAILGIAQLTVFIKNLGLTSRVWKVMKAATIDFASTHSAWIRKFRLEHVMIRESMGKTAAAIHATKAALKGLLATTGIGLLIWGLSEAVSALSSANDAAADSMAKVRDIVHETQAKMAAEQTEAKLLFDKLTTLKEGTEEYAAVRHEIYSKYGDQLKALGDEETALKDVAKAYDTVAASIRNKALAQGRSEALEAAQNDYIDSTKKAREGLQNEFEKKFGVEKGRKLLGDFLTALSEGKEMNENFIKQFEHEYMATTYSPATRGMTYEMRKANNVLFYMNILQQAEEKLKDTVAETDALFADMMGDAPAVVIDPPKAPSGNTPTSKTKALAPEGSAQWYDEQIGELKAKLKLIPETDIQGMDAVQRQIDALTYKKSMMEQRQRDRLYGESYIKMPDLKVELPEINIKDGIEKIDFTPLITGLQTVKSTARETSQALSTGLRGVGDMLGAIAGITDESTGAWLQWGQQVLNACAQALPAIMAVATGNAINSAAQTPIVGWILAGAAVASILASFAAIPKFADGGIAYGPTLGLFGEYAGASNNPEVVAPLSKLRGLLGEGGAGGGGGQVVFEIEGRKLKGVLQKVDHFDSRTR